jgi:hypothetical protein
MTNPQPFADQLEYPLLLIGQRRYRIGGGVLPQPGHYRRADFPADRDTVPVRQPAKQSCSPR